MGSRTMATVITADTMALNAAVFGFAGHSVLTPHQAIQNIWWTDERIDAKVNREFIVSKLRPSERDQLFQPMFSELTEDTYLDWILHKAKRMFLILVECGVSDQIFGIAEDSWDDSDLPLALGEIPRLALSYKNDESLNKRFYNNQFRFLLRPLNFSDHMRYAPNEVIPIEYVHRLAPAAALQKWSRIHLPKMPGLVYSRRKYQMGEKDDVDPELERRFLEDVAMARSIEHEHIADIRATWSQKNMVYLMSSFVGEHTLKSFIDFRSPASLQKMKPTERTTTLVEWLHCLSHAISHLHRKKMAHGAIMPSNILVDENNKIAFADLGFLETFQRDKKVDQDERYNYGAPEHFEGTIKVEVKVPQPAPPSRKFFGHRKKKSTASNSSGETQESTLSLDSKGNFILKSTPRSNSSDTATLVASKPSHSMKSLAMSRNESSSSLSSAMTVERRSAASSAQTSLRSSLMSSSQQSNKQSQAPDDRSNDVFALACVFIDIITFILKKKPQELIKHRSTKHKIVNGKSKNHVDASFHNNLPKVHSWIDILEDDPNTKSDPALQALTPILQLIREMLNPSPHDRPTAAEVVDRISDALLDQASFTRLHCTNIHRTPSILSVPSSASASMSGGSRPSLSSEPRIASFPAILEFSPTPPAVPPKSPKRPATSGSAKSFHPSRLRRDQPRLVPDPMPPVPPLSAAVKVGRI